MWVAIGRAGANVFVKGEIVDRVNCIQARASSDHENICDYIATGFGHYK